MPHNRKAFRFLRRRNRCQRWNTQDQQRIVIRSHPIRLPFATIEAFVNDLLFSIATLDDPYWGHERAAIAAPVTWTLVVDMQRVKAVGTVIPVSSSH